MVARVWHMWLGSSLLDGSDEPPCGWIQLKTSRSIQECKHNLEGFFFFIDATKKKKDLRRIPVWDPWVGQVGGH